MTAAAPISPKATTPSNSSNANKKSWFDMTYDEHWSSEGVEMACKIWNLNDNNNDDDDTAVTTDLLQLKDQLQDLKDYHLNHPLEVARCYFDANFSVQLAEVKFRKMVEWRQQEGIDDLLFDNENQHQPPALMEEYYPSCYLDGYDKDGDPIWIDRTGSSDVWAVYTKYGHLRFRNYVLRTRELALRGPFARQYEQRTGRPPARVTVIMDMDGLCRRHLNRGLIAPLEEGIRFLQDYYGGMAKQIIVSKAPFVFRLVWNIAQYFCNESLKKSIVFCTAKNTQETLDTIMDRKVLPPAFCPEGGQGRPGLGFPQISLEGGIMPTTSTTEESSELMKSKLQSSVGSSSSETVVSCDSTTAASSASSSSTCSTPTSSPRNSCNSITESTGRSSSKKLVVVVKATPLLSGCAHQQANNGTIVVEVQPMEQTIEEDNGDDTKGEQRKRGRRRMFGKVWNKLQLKKMGKKNKEKKDPNELNE